jgi:ribosomal protein S7
MPRRGKIAKRDVLLDPVYNSKVVTRLINNIMLDGKKGVAQKIVYGAFEIVAEKTGKDALEAFEEAMENVMPVLEVKARRKGGATYQGPMENVMRVLEVKARRMGGAPYQGSEERRVGEEGAPMCKNGCAPKH